MFHGLTKGDKVLIVALLVISLFSLYIIKEVSGDNGKYVVIESKGEEIKTFVMGPELEGKIIRVEGALGHTTIEFGKNKVRVISSACRGKDCIKMSWIENPGEMIVCLPNQVSVRIKGKGKEPQVDGGTY